jgi:Cdc6-like AAA superfamily ATPase
MRAELFKFLITDFEEVYVIIDEENNRFHISSVNYHYNISLDLTRDLNVQIDQQTKYGEQSFNKRVRQVLKKIIEELKF